MDLTQLSQEIFKTNEEKGFWDDHIKSFYEVEKINPELAKAVDNAFYSQKLMLISTEVGEAMEAIRDGKECKISNKDLELLSSIEGSGFKDMFELKVKNSFEDELADVIIRTLDTAAAKNIDIQSHILLKLKYNKMRGYKHGKKF